MDQTGGCLAGKADAQRFSGQRGVARLCATLPSPPKENLARCGETFDHHKAGKGCDYFLVAGGQDPANYLIMHKGGSPQ